LKNPATCTLQENEKTIWRQHAYDWVLKTTHLRAPLKIHFGGQANLFDSGRRQAKAALASTKADLPSLPECKNLLLAPQKQLLELPLSLNFELGLRR